MNPSKIFKKTLVKPDGRAVHLYGGAPLKEQSGIEKTLMRESKAHSHLRWHPLREEWVAYASHRQNRTFLPPKEYNPLAPFNSEEFLTELPKGNYQVAVFDNMFSSFNPEATTTSEVYLESRPANGVCEVVVFTQDSDASLAGLPLDHFEMVLRVWSDRYLEIQKHEQIRYILPFENRGVEVGVTLAHPHGQIYAYPFIPPLQQKMLSAQLNFYNKNGKTLLSDMIASEKAEKSRLVCEGESSVAFIPACARYPYETWVAPVRPVGSLADLSDAEFRDFAQTLKTLLLKFDSLWGKKFPYLMVLFCAPTDGEAHPEWHFHIEFYPPLRTKDRLKYLAGTELGAGMFVNDSLPEEKADELRRIEVQ